MIRLMLSLILFMICTVPCFSQLQESAWPCYKGDIRHTGRSPYAGPANPQLKWKCPVKVGRYAAGPSIDNSGIIYIGSTKDDHCLNAVFPDGSLKWRYSWTANDRTTGAPAINQDGTIYLVQYGAYEKDWKGRLHAINPDSSIKWTYQVPDKYGKGTWMRSSPAIDTDGTIYIPDYNNFPFRGGLSAIHPDGTLKWYFGINTSEAVKEPISPFDTLASQAHLWKSLKSGNIQLLMNPDGDPEWYFGERSPGPERDPTSSVTIDDRLGRLYFGASCNFGDHRFLALNREGQLIWAFEAGGPIMASAAIGDDGTIYFGSFDNKLYALDPDGNMKWSFATGGSICNSPIIGWDHTIYAGSNDDYFYALNPDGKMKWSYPVHGISASYYSVWSAVVDINNNLYFGSDDGYFYSLTPDGTERWKFHTGCRIHRPAIGQDGTIYLAGEDYLYALQDSENPAPYREEKKNSVLEPVSPRHYSYPEETLEESKFKKARELLWNGNIEDAMREFRQTVEQNPDFVQGYGEILACYDRKGNVDDALGYFDGLSARFSEYGGVPYAFGKFNQEKNRFIEALKHFEIALEYFQQSGKMAAEAYTLKNIGEIYKVQGELQKGNNYLERALEIFQDIGDQEGELACIIQIRHIYAKLGFPIKGAYYNDSRLEEINSSIDNRFLKASASYFRGDLYLRYRPKEHSLKYYQRALNIFEEIGDRRRAGHCHNNIGVMRDCLSNSVEAFQNYEEASNIFEEIADLCGKNTCLNNIGVIYRNTEQYEDAIQAFRKALKTATQFDHRDIEGACLYNIGLIYVELGMHEKALSVYREALKISKDIGIRQGEGRIHNSMGIVLNHLGQYSEAEQHLQASLRMGRESGDPTGELASLNNIGVLLANQGRYEEALKLYEQSLNKSPDLDFNCECYNHIGFAYLRKTPCDTQSAISNFNQVLQIGEKIGRPDIIWQAQYGLALAFKKDEMWDQGLDKYREAITTVEEFRALLREEENKIGFLEEKVGVYKNFIDLLYTLFDIKENKKYLEEAFDYAERFRSRAFLDLLAETDTVIRRFVEPQLLESQEETQILMDRIKQNMLKPRTTEEDRERLRKQIATVQADKDEEKLFNLNYQLKKLQHEFITDQEWQSLDADLKKEKKEYQKIQEQIRQSHQDYIKEYYTPCDLKKTQRLLPDDQTVLLEYVLGENRSFLFLVTKHNFNVYTLPARETLEGLITSYLEKISSRVSDISRCTHDAYQLYKGLVQPAEGAIMPDAKLVVIPDGLLHALPFEALVTRELEGKGEESAYLIYQYSISYIQSATVLGSLLREKGEESEPSEITLLAFGDPVFNHEEVTPAMHSAGRDDQVSAEKTGQEDGAQIKKTAESQPGMDEGYTLRSFYHDSGFKLQPLPYSGVEVDKISALFPQASQKIFKKHKATEDIFKQEESKHPFGIVHFATHALINEKIPKHSCIVLAQDNDPAEDGFLQMSEIFNIPIEAELVVLSACETGRGKLLSGEGLMGLARAFMCAGASSVSVTLWKVSDRSTADFMEHFYTALRAGKGKAESLRYAKLQMLKSPRPAYHHPFYWAPFVLFGSGE